MYTPQVLKDFSSNFLLLHRFSPLNYSKIKYVSMSSSGWLVFIAALNEGIDMVKDAEAGTPYAPINIIPTFPFLG